VVGGSVPAMKVTCEWGAHGVESAPPDAIIVIVDVLCFTTCVSVACRQGATVFPCEWNDARATALGAAETAVVAAKRGERGFTLSPASFTRVPRGLRVVLPSPNGSTLASPHAHATRLPSSPEVCAMLRRWRGGRARSSGRSW
jgi:2-phosphosulfolactate phosphatase